MRRALRKPRSVSEGPNLLPLLIQVLASFSKADGVLLEEEIDSSLGFLRYDYPEAVYSELRQLFRQALYEQQDLSAMAQKLAASAERRSQDHARGAALRSDFASRPEAGAGRRILLLHVAARHGGAGDRHRLSTERLGGFRPADLSARRVAARVALFRHQRRGRRDAEESDRKRSAPRLSLSRSDPAEELQLAGGLGARPAARARRILPDLSRATHSDRRSGAHLPGSGDLFQRQEERLAPANFRAGEQGFRRSGTGTLALARKLARSDFRPEGAGQGVARRRRDAERRQTEGRHAGRSDAR